MLHETILNFHIEAQKDYQRRKMGVYTRKTVRFICPFVLLPKVIRFDERKKEVLSIFRKGPPLFWLTCSWLGAVNIVSIRG